MTDDDTKPSVVVMGVSGSGKSTVGALIAATMGVPFVDADDLHPAENIAAMAAGIALDDRARAPWLTAVGTTIHDAAGAGTGIVMACSALRRAYRDRIRELAPDTVFVQLTGSHDVLLRRMTARLDHFMPADLLASQLATLEDLADDEPGFVIDIDSSASELAHRAVAQLAGTA